MSFKLSTGNNAYPSASASVTNGNDSSTVKVTASCYLGDGWVQSTGVVAKIYINGSHVSTQTILGNGSSYSASDGTKSVSASKSITKTTSSQSISWYVQFHQYTDGTDQGNKETLSGSASVSALASYTISYNANGGTGAPDSQTKYYGKTLTLSSDKPTRTGYTFEGWALTKAEADSGDWHYTAGDACGKNEGLTLYATWTEHILTINYYSNKADYCTLNGEAVSVSSSTNVKVHTSTHSYSASQPNGLANVQNENNLYLSKTGYTPTEKWGTSESGGTLVDQSTGFDTGQEFAEAFGKSLKTGNASVNVYIQWTENYLTVNYYSNYATSAFDGAENTVGANKNVLVKTQKFYYDDAYDTYGLSNYSGSGGSAYMTRTGYTATGNWGTSTSGGTLVDEDTGFASGQKLAEAFNKSLKTGNASVNVYAQWRENILTVRYHSNYATSAFDGAENAVGADKDVVVRTAEFKYATAYSDGLHNYSSSNAGTHLARTRYDATGYWGTAKEIELGRDPIDDVIVVNGAIAVNENCGFASGAELAEAFGKLSVLQSGDTSLDIYALWVLLCSRVSVYLPDGSVVRGLCHFYDDNGERHYAILTVYGSDGKARVVI